MRNRCSWWLATLLAVVIGSSSTTAKASEEQDRALALQLGNEAVELYNAQRYEDALDRFTNAETLVHSPVFVLYMARIERKRGKWVRALSHYDRVLDEKLADDAPDTWQRAREEGRLERERLLAEVPTVRIVLEGADETASVWLDGSALADWSQPVAVDPGRHEIAAQRGNRSASTHVEVAEGQKEVVATIRFSAPAPAQRPRAPTPGLVGTKAPSGLAPVPSYDDRDAPLSDQRKAGYALLVIGGAASTAFAGVSIAAVIRDRQLADQCLERKCPEAFDAKLAEYDRLRNATLGLGVASAALLITGWIVAATAPRGDAPTALRLGPGHASLQVRF